jgi:hypothetical protein
LASPANARDCIVAVPISAKLTARKVSPKPGMSLSSSGSTASGVVSRPVKPVPPVISTPCTRSSAIQFATRARMRYLLSLTMLRSCSAWPASVRAATR